MTLNPDNEKQAFAPKKVAMIFGSLAHQRHTQMYEGFDPKYRFIAVGARVCDLGESDISLEHRKLLSIRDLARNIPKIRNRIPFADQQYFFGFEKALSDVDLLFPGGSLMRFSYQCILMKRKTGIKVVLMDLENVPFAYHDRAPKRLMERDAVLKECDAIIASTYQVRQCMLMEGVPDDKIQVIYNGIRTDIFSPGPKNPDVLRKLGLNENDIVVLYLGEFNWRKGPITKLFAAKLFDDDPEVRDTPTKFVFLGRNGDAMRKLAEKMGLGDRVIVHDWMSYNLMPDIYRSSDIVVVPSIPVPAAYEQGSCVLAEGGSTGKPMVVSQAGAMPELIGDAALFFPPADYETLYLRMKELVLDENKREEYGRRARTRACEVQDSSMTREKTARLFDQVLG